MYNVSWLRVAGNMSESFCNDFNHTQISVFVHLEINCTIKKFLDKCNNKRGWIQCNMTDAELLPEQ